MNGYGVVMNKLSWTHNDDERRWELRRGEDLVRGSFVTDEFVAYAAMPRPQLKQHIERKFGAPLPAEAFPV